MTDAPPPIIMPGHLVQSVVDPNLFWIFDDKLGNLEEFFIRKDDVHFLATRLNPNVVTVNGAPCIEYAGWEFTGAGGMPVENACYTFRVYVSSGALKPKSVTVSEPVEGVETWLK